MNARPFALPSSLRQEAALLRLTYMMGLVDHATVIAWADAAILMLAKATEDLTSLALADASRGKAVFGLLGQLAAGADQELADRQALGLLRGRFHSGDIDNVSALRALKQYRKFGRRDPTQESWISVLDDEYELGLMGYPNSPDGVAKAIGDFLDANADSSFDSALFDRP